MPQSPTIVLAHGAWADGSSWSKVIAGLRRQGVTSIAAPLPLTTFQDDVEALDRSIARAEGDVVVAGHAYAGGVIGAATSAKVRALVYIAALAPNEGETVAEVFYRAPPHPKAPKLEPDAHGLIYLPDAAFAEAFAPHASTDEQEVLRAWYLLAQEDRMIAAEIQAFMAGRMNATVRRHPVDHIPIVTAPEPCVEIIMDAVSAL